MFLSPGQFDDFFWPSFKKVLLILIDAGYQVRIYLEGDWSKHWHHMLELPKGKVLCDIDTQADIFKAIDDLGQHLCLAGGVPESTLMLGTPKAVRERVKVLCAATGKDKRLLVNGGCNIPYGTKPENYRAMIDAILEFATYDSKLQHAPKAPAPVKRKPVPRVVTPWSQKLSELGGIQGDEQLIRLPWEQLESMAYAWIWHWAL